MGQVVIENGSMVDRVFRMVSEAQEAGRLSSAEAAIVYELIWHPDFPQKFRDRQPEDALRQWWPEASRQKR